MALQGQHALVTGGSGIALGLPANFRRAGLLPYASLGQAQRDVRFGAFVGPDPAPR